MSTHPSQDSRGFRSRTLSKWSDLSGQRQDGWLYRGQASADWHLATSLERTCQRHEIPLDRVPTAEIKFIREFRRRYHQYRPPVRQEDDTLEWLSIMQHFGAPTRLLDFTYSAFIAAYFALEGQAIDGNSAVWAIRGNWVVNSSSREFPEASDAHRYIQGVLDEKTPGGFTAAFYAMPAQTFACCVNPFRLNERLTLQRGVFMCPGNVGQSFEDNLKALPDWDKEQNLYQLVIPPSMRQAGLKDLLDMNISRATLFPGLDGFARSLSISIPRGWDELLR